MLVGTIPGLSTSIRRRDAFARIRVLRGTVAEARTTRDDEFDQRARAGDAPGTVLYERLSMGVDREPTLRTVEVRHGMLPLAGALRRFRWALRGRQPFI